VLSGILGISLKKIDKKRVKERAWQRQEEGWSGSIGANAEYTVF